MIGNDVIPEAAKVVQAPPVKQTLADESAAIIRDHKFSPKDYWFSLCRHCNLAESAHEETELEYIGDGQYEGFEDDP